MGPKINCVGFGLVEYVFRGIQIMISHHHARGAASLPSILLPCASEAARNPQWAPHIDLHRLSAEQNRL